MVRTQSFTGHNATPFIGTPAYFHMPNPQPPSVRTAVPMGIQGYIQAPQPGPLTAYKAGVSPNLTAFQTTALSPQGPVTYSTLPGGQGYIR